MVNPITTGSIKGHSCEQWKEEEWRQEIEVERRKKNGKKERKDIKIQEK